ncbi:hypothetical protein ACTTXG_000803 [Acinetobacter baumannii]|uniref:hypothetical protein n=1 Tax=Acinetobacter baumannii TaxID=470 RepID=UPI0003DF35B8|nr:hypothetical protein [Acinetobacter baumannii]EKT9795027.1 hypothetical protein [Acinetobacter baumannii]EKU2032392.1 hypothetical protein [Acinetobacter baumannii]EKU2074898.1 hypothetical protein [Acinetobacter baumannii]EKU2090751.1 hypothetical protein [Acinetobacter baumannii]EKU2289119.1 hypothetical protein [Acinetobacter baumannii]
MAFKQKQKTVEAEPVGAILDLFETDFKSLPDWVKRAYKDQKILFGYGLLKLIHVSFTQQAVPGDVLVSHENGKLEVLPENKFFETYELVDETLPLPQE